MMLALFGVSMSIYAVDGGFLCNQVSVLPFVIAKRRVNVE
jgi:hypothetical protein